MSIPYPPSTLLSPLYSSHPQQQQQQDYLYYPLHYSQYNTHHIVDVDVEQWDSSPQFHSIQQPHPFPSRIKQESDNFYPQQSYTVLPQSHVFQSIPSDPQQAYSQSAFNTYYDGSVQPASLSPDLEYSQGFVPDYIDQESQVSQDQPSDNTSEDGDRDADADDDLDAEGEDDPGDPDYIDEADQVPTQVSRPRRTCSNSSMSATSRSSMQSTLFGTNGTVGDALHTRRRARSVAPLPVPIPVPNLTKKSRGRRVPTVASMECGGRGGKHRGCHHLSRDGDGDAGGKWGGTRMYTCKVNGCGKCFARGEHLKRHVRSIHTYEKREFCLSRF
jgi:hypothetical protein